MTSSFDRAQLLFDEALNAPRHSAIRVALLVEAAEHADASGDRFLAYDVNRDLIESAIFSGAMDRGLAAFSYCLSLSDAHPHDFPEDDLLWSYKWMIEEMCWFTEVSRETATSLLEDAARRFARAGAGAGAILKLRAVLAWAYGEPEQVPALFDAWQAARRDHLSDCHACDVSVGIEIAMDTGRPEAGLAALQDMLAQQIGCAEVPHVTYAATLPHLIAIGDAERLASYHTRGERLLSGLGNKRVGGLGLHLLAAAVLGDHERGAQAMRSVLSGAAIHPVARQRLDALLGAEVLVHHVGRAHPTMLLALPETFGGDGARRAWPVAELERALADHLDPIAAAFDARNGNTWVTRQVAERRRFKDVVLSRT